MGIRVVTDSSCDLPSALVEALGIEIVPLTIRFGDEEFVDQVDLTIDEFWSRIEQSPTLPETAAPSPGAFEAKFRDLMNRGATGIVCINLSSHLSGTMQSAQVASAAVAADGPVQVIDSQSASMGLGNLCLTAARRAADGDSLES
ncbi:MAG TPA: DegV family protein, partial [Acidimicrobiia bacterium]